LKKHCPGGQYEHLSFKYFIIHTFPFEKSCADDVICSSLADVTAKNLNWGMQGLNKLTAVYSKPAKINLL
jgi:hypothetical protein